MATRQFTEGMDEISGFGGGYEDTCRKMVLAGMEWWEAHPSAKPTFHSYEGVYGILMEDNDDAKSLTKAVTEAVGDCTGAMHQAAMSHIAYAHQNGWDKYVEEMKKKK